MDERWREINDRRISEKTQEIRLYCAQKRRDMTLRAFDLARLSFERLLDNIADREKYSMVADVVESIRRGMDLQDECIAVCSEKQAAVLARSIVYKCVGDDLDLYPITAEKKLLRAKVRGLKECNIPKEEMTTRDFLFVASAIAEGENFSKNTMRAVYEWFKEIGLNPTQARVFSVLFRSKKPLSIHAIPQYDLFHSEYKKAMKYLVERGFITELPGGVYCITETAFV